MVKRLSTRIKEYHKHQKQDIVTDLGKSITPSHFFMIGTPATRMKANKIAKHYDLFLPVNEFVERDGLLVLDDVVKAYSDFFNHNITYNKLDFRGKRKVPFKNQMNHYGDAVKDSSYFADLGIIIYKDEV